MTTATSIDIRWDTIDLPPDLPVSVFTSMEPWRHERIGALALYCSDGRWGEAFDEFCHKHLLIPRYDRWAVPGGPAVVAGRGEDAALTFDCAAAKDGDGVVPSGWRVKAGSYREAPDS